MKHRRQHRGLAVPAAAVLCLGLLAACGDDDDSAGPETGTSIEDVQESVPPVAGPGSLVGRTVTISGEVEDVLTNRSFTIGAEDDDTEDLLVIHGPGLSVREEQVVQVTGVVRAGFKVADVEDDLDFDLDDDFFDDPLFDRYEIEPYLVTKAVQDATRDSAAAPNANPTATTTEMATPAPRQDDATPTPRS